MNTRFFNILLFISIVVLVGCAPSGINLSKDGTANSYIVSECGTYKFKTVKGNSSESVGEVKYVEVLWETFGTDVKPNVGDLIKSVEFTNGWIKFDTNPWYKEGNALIAAIGGNGNILWSWHIWFTDQPHDQVYYNGAGIMMDRNLGATSATPGDVGALGLLYQWGRKDPFLGASSIKKNTQAKSTRIWLGQVNSDAFKGTIEYAIQHPTTFITENDENDDWYYTGDESTDNTRWQSTKTIYDPCPPGYRVPDGGENGIWSKPLNNADSFHYSGDMTKKGIDFSGEFGASLSIWYPCAGCLYSYFSQLEIGDVGRSCSYWSVTPNKCEAYCLKFYFDFSGGTVREGYRGEGNPVRCCKE